MSFFDNTKVAGWGLFIVGIIAIISALLQLVDAFDTEDLAANVVVAIGALLAAFIFFGYGNKVRKGKISDKIDVLAQFIRTYGYATVVSSLFTAIAGIWSTNISTWSAIIMLIIGLIVMWIGGKVNDGKATNFDRVLWIILVVVFFVLFILKLVACFDGGGIIDIISNILFAIIYLYMLAFLFDHDVRKKMKM